MTTRPRRKIAVSPAQAVYLEELLVDDLDLTELDDGERRRAGALLEKVRLVIGYFVADGDLE